MTYKPTPHAFLKTGDGTPAHKSAPPPPFGAEFRLTTFASKCNAESSSSMAPPPSIDARLRSNVVPEIAPRDSWSTATAPPSEAVFSTKSQTYKSMLLDVADSAPPLS